MNTRQKLKNTNNNNYNLQIKYIFLKINNKLNTTKTCFLQFKNEIKYHTPRPAEKIPTNLLK